MYIYKESIHALFVQRAPQTLPRSPPPKVMKRGIERATRLTSMVAAVDVRTFTASQSMATFVDDGARLVPAHAIRKNDIIILDDNFEVYVEKLHTTVEHVEH